jgi:hypothetical protein
MSKTTTTDLTPAILADIRKGTQILLKNHLKDNPEETKSGLATKIGIHPLQMLAYLKGERGLTDKSLQKIGKFLKASK